MVYSTSGEDPGAVISQKLPSQHPSILDRPCGIGTHGHRVIGCDLGPAVLGCMAVRRFCRPRVAYARRDWPLPVSRCRKIALTVNRRYDVARSWQIRVSYRATRAPASISGVADARDSPSPGAPFGSALGLWRSRSILQPRPQYRIQPSLFFHAVAGSGCFAQDIRARISPQFW